MQDYLKQYPQDMDFLLLEAKLKVETILLSDAIAHYYDLLRNPMTANLGRSIPLTQFGDQYVVAAKLSGNQVALLIDTGASVTAISTQYFDNLSNRYKANFLGRFSIGTAGGSIMASMYQFRELTINHVTVQNLPVVILPIQGIANADGLLGMNFLREFDFKIDQRQSVMFIK